MQGFDAMVRRAARARVPAVGVALVLLVGSGGNAVACPPAPARLVIATDQQVGGGLDADGSVNKAIGLYLDQVGHAAGRFRVEQRVYDYAAAGGGWDGARCLENANAHVRHADEVAVVGPMHSGCAAIEVPVTNRAPTGPLVMVSNAATKPGLTKAEDPGEPGMYYPTGKRSFARTVAPTTCRPPPTRGWRGTSASVRVYVLHDSWTYGQGMARFFAAHARRNGITVIADSGWDPEASSYTDLFQTIKASRPDAVYFAG